MDVGSIIGAISTGLATLGTAGASIYTAVTQGQAQGQQYGGGMTYQSPAMSAGSATVSASGDNSMLMLLGIGALLLLVGRK